MEMMSLLQVVRQGRLANAALVEALALLRVKLHANVLQGGLQLQDPGLPPRAWVSCHLQACLQCLHIPAPELLRACRRLVACVYTKHPLTEPPSHTAPLWERWDGPRRGCGSARD